MTAIVVIDPSDEVVITIDWTDTIGDATLGTVTHTLPAGLTLLSEATSAADKQSQVKVSGATHGRTYLIEGQSTLSDGQVVNRQFPCRCFNG